MTVARNWIVLTGLLLLQACSESTSDNQKAVESPSDQVHAESAKSDPQEDIEQNPLRNAYFGDLHVHTMYSFDAFLFGTRRNPDDAYEFAKGKPLTLLNGSNLLHLLEKHGHRAKIDLKEAKKLLAENQN